MFFDFYNKFCCKYVISISKCKKTVCKYLNWLEFQISAFRAFARLVIIDKRAFCTLIFVKKESFCRSTNPFFNQARRQSCLKPGPGSSPWPLPANRNCWGPTRFRDSTGRQIDRGLERQIEDQTERKRTRQIDRGPEDRQIEDQTDR